MDTLAFMFLTALGIVCWIVGAFMRPLSPMWVKIGVYPGVAILFIYFVILLSRSEAALWSGTAEAGPGAVWIIALGIYSAIAKRVEASQHISHHGGPRSA